VSSTRERADQALIGAGIGLAFIAGGAAFQQPKPPTGRQLARRVLFATAARFVALQWVAPKLRAQFADIEDTRVRLTEKLGREPTVEEILEFHAAEKGWFAS
jgi:hypothetical protein